MQWDFTRFIPCSKKLSRGGAFADLLLELVAEYNLLRVAYAKALEKLTGANVGQLLPIPDVSNKKFPEAMKHEAKGVHRIMWHFSPEDYTELDQIWNGPHPEDGGELEFRRNEMPEGFPWPEAPDEPQLVSPGAIDPDMLKFFAKKLE